MKNYLTLVRIAFIYIVPILISYQVFSQTTETFNYTGAVQSWTVPAGVIAINVDVKGASGGNGNGMSGGLGGRVQAILQVTPGTVLYLYVGGKGTDGVGAVSDNASAGGFNGGGNGGFDASGQVQNGGAGGGGSDIRMTGMGLPNRIIIAGGGGGGAAGFISLGNTAGNGGGLTGQSALNYFSSAIGGGGGSQVSGGSAYLTRGATLGSLGIGGNGSSNQNAWGSAGGGGGYYGGGGGSGVYDHGQGFSASGGGGSSYTDVGIVSSVTHTQGVQNGDGQIIFSYTINNTITTGSAPQINCPNSTFSLNYTAAGTFDAGNTFTAQLSDATGSFASPVAIGSVSSTTSGSISATIPANVIYGTGYRIRVVSDNPIVTGIDNGADLTVGDNQKPTFTCPLAQTIDLNADCKLVVPDLITGLTGNDNCGTVTFTQDPAATAELLSSHDQTHNIVITADDGNGNTEECTVVLTGNDVTKPTFTCPLAQIINLNANCELVVPDLITGLTGSDNCGTVTFTQNPVAAVALSSSHNQTHNIVIMANDGNGNTEECTVVLTGNDVTKPTFTCPLAQTIDLNGNCELVVPDLITGLIGSDNCGTVNFTQNPAAAVALSSSENQPHNVVITANDGNGNTEQCTVVLTGNDVAKPTFTCPLAQTIDLNGNCELVVPDLIIGLTGSDNCGTVTFTQNPLAAVALSSSDNLTHNIVITANDGNGNTEQCTVVLTGNDVIQPTIDCPTDITVDNDAGICGAIVNYSITTTDNCSGSGNNYNQSSCTYAPFTMSGSTFLLSGDDNIQGPFSLPFNFNFYGTNFNSYYASTNGFISFTFPGVGQGCCTGQVLPNCNFLNSIALGWTDWVTTVTMKVLGTAPNRIVVFEWSGGEWGGSGSVIGQISLFETTNEIRLITNNINVTNPYHLITQGLNKDCSVANPVDGRNSQIWSASNECISFLPGVTTQLVSGITTGSSFPLGTTTNTYVATDAAGNTSTCSFNVTVVDNEDPTIVCPAAANGNTNDDGTGNCTTTVSLGTPTTGDNCHVASVKGYIGTTEIDPVTHLFAIGQTTVIWKVTDDAGNTAQCDQIVTITDNEDPTITCPADSPYTKSTNEGLCTYKIVGTEFDATATDNCDTSTLDWDITGATTNSGTGSMADVNLNFGENTITWTATDTAGNESTCSITVNVNKVTTTTIVTVTPISQQYSDKVSFVATVTPYNCTGAGAIGGKVTFKIGDLVMGEANIDANGLATLSNIPLLEDMLYDSNLNDPLNPTDGPLKPGFKTVTAYYSGTDPDYMVSNPTTPLEVTCENADITYNGQTYFTVNPNNLSGTLVLSDYVLDRDDTPTGARGDIRNATATFWNGAINGTVLGTPDTPVGLVNPLNKQEGFVTTSLNTTLTSSEASGGGRLYDVFSGLNNYYCGTDGPTPVTLALPGQDFVTGGGYIVFGNNSAGTYAGTSGKRMNFGFVMKWNPSGKNLQGKVNIIYRRMVNGVQRIYQIKGTSIGSLVVENVNNSGGIATGSAITFRRAIISTKANLNDITNPLSPISLGGNLSLVMTAWESTTVNTGVLDRVGVQLSGAGSVGLLFSSNWSGGKTVWQTLNGGKIQVRNSSTSAGSTAKTAEVSKPEESSLFNVKTYPNPTNYEFTLVIEGGSTEKIDVTVYDIFGRMVNHIEKSNGQPIQFGEKLPRGYYTAIVKQGANQQTVKLIKQE